jgi:hypothetical protein
MAMMLLFLSAVISCLVTINLAYAGILRPDFAENDCEHVTLRPGIGGLPTVILLIPGFGSTRDRKTKTHVTATGVGRLSQEAIATFSTHAEKLRESLPFFDEISFEDLKLYFGDADATAYAIALGESIGYWQVRDRITFQSITLTSDDAKKLEIPGMTRVPMGYFNAYQVHPELEGRSLPGINPARLLDVGPYEMYLPEDQVIDLEGFKRFLETAVGESLGPSLTRENFTSQNDRINNRIPLIMGAGTLLGIWQLDFYGNPGTREEKSRAFYDERVAVRPPVK